MKESTISTIALIILTILAAIAVAIALCLYFGDDATPAEEPAVTETPVEEAAPAKVCVKIFKNYYDKIENVVNEWLEQHPDVEIISIQNAVIDDYRTTVTIVYAEK